VATCKGSATTSFDLTSCIRCMFAPKPFDVAKEMAGSQGQVVVCDGYWIPKRSSSFVSQLLKISSSSRSTPRRLRQFR